jgi:glutathione synthase/RimK-type ligase-like ATP-grasp enzyme
MARILLGGAGGAPTNNVIMSLRAATDGDYLIGMGSLPSDLLLADVDERHVVPPAVAPDYADRLERLIRATRPDLLHVQHDFEVRRVSGERARFEALGVKLLLPDHATVETCVDKMRSYEVWRRAGLKVPETMLVTDPACLDAAFDRFGGRLWLRATEGGGGTGALPTDNREFARLWIDVYRGWGRFTAAEQLTAQSVTWLSIWYDGELIVAQTRRRRAWSFAGRTLSGVTGITGVAETVSEPAVTETAMAAVTSIDPRPHGIFSVDLTYDSRGVPRLTEINIGRFFTTVHFFTVAGVNFPKIYRDLAISGKKPSLERVINPLPDGLVWIRGMDVAPRLVAADELASLESSLSAGLQDVPPRPR